MRPRVTFLLHRIRSRAWARAVFVMALALFAWTAGAFWTEKARAEEAPAGGAPGQDPVAGGVEPAPAVPGEESALAPRVGEDRALEIIEKASGSAGEEKPGLKRKSRRADRVREREKEARREAEEAPRWVEPLPGWSGYPWTWGWYPWYGLPQTRPLREYPPSITHVPRLGLQYNYPWAYQMGIRIPDDSDPLDHPPTLGPFVGVVQAAKEELLRAQEAAAEESPDLLQTGLALLRAGEYGSAGKVLLAGFELSDDPEYPVLLTEVFFALGKPVHAEALLRHALRLKGGLRALPGDLAGHFPSPDVFETKLEGLAKAGGSKLLTGYLLLYSKSPERGVEALRSLASERPEDEEAGALYRHSLKVLLPK